MTNVKYAFNNFNDHTASAYGRSLHISTKVSINICNALRYKSVDKAVAYLNDVIAMKRAIPYTRFTDGVGHRKGPMAAGRFPVKAATLIRDLIKSAASNAENQGFGEDLKIVHLCAHRASEPMRQGRQRSRSAKRTHIEVVVKERAPSKQESKEEKPKAQSNKTASAPKKAPFKEAVSTPKPAEKPVVKEQTTKQESKDSSEVPSQ